MPKKVTRPPRRGGSIQPEEDPVDRSAQQLRDENARAQDRAGLNYLNRAVYTSKPGPTKGVTTAGQSRRKHPAATGSRVDAKNASAKRARAEDVLDEHDDEPSHKKRRSERLIPKPRPARQADRRPNVGRTSGETLISPANGSAASTRQTEPSIAKAAGAKGRKAVSKTPADAVPNQRSTGKPEKTSSSRSGRSTAKSSTDVDTRASASAPIRSSNGNLKAVGRRAAAMLDQHQSKSTKARTMTSTRAQAVAAQLDEVDPEVDAFRSSSGSSASSDDDDQREGDPQSSVEVEDSDGSGSDSRGERPSWAHGPRDWHGHCCELGEASTISNKTLSLHGNISGGEAASISKEMQRLQTDLKTHLTKDPNQGHEKLPPNMSQRLTLILQRLKAWKEALDCAERDTAKEVALHLWAELLPRLASTLIMMLRFFGTRPNLNQSQLESSIPAMKQIVHLHKFVQRLREQHDNFRVELESGPVMKAIERVVARVRDAEKAFSAALHSLTSEARTQASRLEWEARAKERVQQEMLDAANAKKLQGWRDTWSNLHADRRLMLFIGGRRCFDSRLDEHLRDVPVDSVARDATPLPPLPSPRRTPDDGMFVSPELGADDKAERMATAGTREPAADDDEDEGVGDSDSDVSSFVSSSSADSDALLETDANGTPIKRVQLFGARTSQLPLPALPPPRQAATTVRRYDGPPFTSKQDAALLRVLDAQSAVGRGRVPWAGIFRQLCLSIQSPGGGYTENVLGRCSVGEIVERATWLRDLVRQRPELVQGKSTAWADVLVDPRVRPVL